jgi:hypothetical protein
MTEQSYQKIEGPRELVHEMEDHIYAVQNIAHSFLMMTHAMTINAMGEQEIGAFNRLAGNLLEHAEAIEARREKLLHLLPAGRGGGSEG